MKDLLLTNTFARLKPGSYAFGGSGYVVLAKATAQVTSLCKTTT